MLISLNKRADAVLQRCLLGLQLSIATYLHQNSAHPAVQHNKTLLASVCYSTPRVRSCCAAGKATGAEFNTLQPLPAVAVHSGWW